MGWPHTACFEFVHGKNGSVDLPVVVTSPEQVRSGDVVLVRQVAAAGATLSTPDPRGGQSAEPALASASFEVIPSGWAIARNVSLTIALVGAILWMLMWVWDAAK